MTSMTLSGTITNFDSGSAIYYQVVYFNFSASDGTSPTFQGMTEDTSARVLGMMLNSN